MLTAIQFAKRTGRGAFTPPYSRPGTSDHVSFVAPIMQGGQVMGILHAEISLARVLAQHVPWWIAEKRAVLIKRGDEKLAASRSKVDPDKAALSYTVEIGPPLKDLWLTLASYQNRSSLVQNGLVVAMIVLSFLAAGALIARERQLRGRKLAEAARDGEYAFRRSMEQSLRVGIRARDLDGSSALRQSGLLPHGRLLGGRSHRPRAADALLGAGGTGAHAADSRRRTCRRIRRGTVLR